MKVSKMTKSRKCNVRRELAGGRQYVYCHYCGHHGPWFSMTLDHVVPRAAGGTNAVENLVLCCTKCNRAKADMTSEQFRASLRHEVRP